MARTVASKAVPAEKDRLSRLRRLADRLESKIASTDSPTGVASLSRSLVIVLEQIDTLAPPAQPKGTVLDEVEAKRAARRAAAKAPARPARNG